MTGSCSGLHSALCSPAFNSSELAKSNCHCSSAQSYTTNSVTCLRCNLHRSSAYPHLQAPRLRHAFPNANALIRAHSEKANYQRTAHRTVFRHRLAYSVRATANCHVLGLSRRLPFLRFSTAARSCIRRVFGSLLPHRYIACSGGPSVNFSRGAHGLSHRQGETRGGVADPDDAHVPDLFVSWDSAVVDADAEVAEIDGDTRDLRI